MVEVVENYAIIEVLRADRRGSLGKVLLPDVQS